jgi:hypothetical protein
MVHLLTRCVYIVRYQVQLRHSNKKLFGFIIENSTAGLREQKPAKL